MTLWVLKRMLGGGVTCIKLHFGTDKESEPASSISRLDLILSVVAQPRWGWRCTWERGLEWPLKTKYLVVFFMVRLIA